MFPLTITFKDFEPSEAVRTAIQEKADRLERFEPRITSGRVVVAAPHHHSNKGNVFHIQIVIHVPGHEFVVSREPEKDGAHEDIYVAIRDAFRALERQMTDYSEKRR